MVNQPLSGLRVVEYGELVCGPYCAKMLADLGAEVVKVEPPGSGDMARSQGPFPGDIPHLERSGLFLYLNLNKIGVTLDLGKGEGRQILGRLLEQADVFVENHPPSQMEAQGLGYSHLHALNPRLIVTSISPFGQRGPYRDMKADSLISVNMGSLAYGSPGLPDHVDDPEKEPPLKGPLHLGDFIAGLMAAIGTMLALFARQKKGQGAHVDISEQEAVAAMAVRDVISYSYGNVVTGRILNATARAPNTYLPCKDGYVVVAAPTDAQWQNLLKVMDNPSWAESDLFQDPYLRGVNYDALNLLLTEWTMSLTGEEICQKAQAMHVPCFPAYTLGAMVNSPQMEARYAFSELERPEVGYARYPGAPYRFGEPMWQLRQPAPLLGQHNEEILCGRLGYSPREMVQLRAAGVI